MFEKSRLGSICYYVANIEKTEQFYRDTLGLDVQRMGDDGSGNDWLMATTANEVELIFFKMNSTPADSPIIVFELAQGGIDDIIAALEQKGVTIVTAVSEAPGGWSAEFADPDGHVISMYQSEDMSRTQG